jgi:hypothetical protein
MLFMVHAAGIHGGVNTCVCLEVVGDMFIQTINILW